MTVKLDKAIYLTDRSAAETDDTCGMKFWWNRLEGNRGIVPKEDQLPLLIGRETHSDLEAITRMDSEELSPEGLEAVTGEILDHLTLADRQNQKLMEMVYRRLGWLVGFALYIEPKIRKRYETVGVEKEIILDRSPLWVAVTPDRVLRDKTDGHLEYLEYKTTISASQKWLNSWIYQIQLHIGLAALSEELGEKIQFAQIMGLMKGNSGWGDAVEKQGRLHHPYVWGYYNGDTKAWTWDYNQARASNWSPLPVWEYEGGIVKWVQLAGLEVALQQFPFSPPVFLNSRLLDKWVERRLSREMMIRAVKEPARENPTLKNIHFPMIQSRCKPPFGDQCQYLKACWNAETNLNPLGSGDFIERVPHHEMEIVGIGDGVGDSTE
jgi:hypothetical protein